MGSKYYIIVNKKTTGFAKSIGNSVIANLKQDKIQFKRTFVLFVYYIILY